jgi:hypothetical protein
MGLRIAACGICVAIAGALVGCDESTYNREQQRMADRKAASANRQESLKQYVLKKAQEANSLDEFAELVKENRRFSAELPAEVAGIRRGWYVRTHPAAAESCRQLIAQGKITIGMSAEEVRASWGEPLEINRTISGSGVDEQWVFGDQDYVYFHNAVLTVIQQ